MAFFAPTLRLESLEERLSPALLDGLPTLVSGLLPAVTVPATLPPVTTALAVPPGSQPADNPAPAVTTLPVGPVPAPVSVPEVPSVSATPVPLPSTPLPVVSTSAPAPAPAPIQPSTPTAPATPPVVATPAPAAPVASATPSAPLVLAPTPATVTGPALTPALGTVPSAGIQPPGAAVQPGATLVASLGASLAETMLPVPQVLPAQVGQTPLLPVNPNLLSVQPAVGNTLAFIGPAPLPTVSENGAVPLEPSGPTTTPHGFLVTPNGGGGDLDDEGLPMPEEEAPLPPLGMEGAEPVLDFQPGAVRDTTPRQASLLSLDVLGEDGMPRWAVLLLAISSLAGGYLAVPQRKRERTEEGLLPRSTRMGGWHPLS